MNSWTKRVLFGAGIGVLAALLVGLAVNTYITDVATQINDKIIADHGRQPTLKVSQEAQAAYQRVSLEGGMTGAVANQILANNGIGYPDVSPPTAKVWRVMALTGAIVGASASWRKRSWVVFVALFILLKWLSETYDSPVAEVTISVTLVASAVVAYAIFTLPGSVNW